MCACARACACFRVAMGSADAPCTYARPAGYVCSYDCDEYEQLPGPALPCTSAQGLLERVNGLQSTCCPDGSCANGLPTSCDFACELALLAFTTDCKDFFGLQQLQPIIDPVFALCEATAPQADPTEVGGNQIDHFVIGNLMECTNLAHGQPATQSTTGFGGDAENAVDGEQCHS